MSKETQSFNLHSHAADLLTLAIQCDKRKAEVERELRVFNKAGWSTPTRLFNKEWDFTDRIEKCDKIKARIMQSYHAVMLKLYSPDFSKTENLWHTLAATKLFLEIKSPITPEFIEEIKKVLNDNRP